jgi:hypothetical protein
MLDPDEAWEAYEVSDENDTGPCGLGSPSDTAILEASFKQDSLDQVRNLANRIRSSNRPVHAN